MPRVNGKHFAYTKAGYKAAAKAKRKLRNKSYSKDAVVMAKMMSS